MPRAGLVRVVLLREALRQSRRPRTWVLRLLFAGALIGALALSWSATLEGTIAVDASQFGRAGRSLFMSYAFTQLFLVTLIAPALVAQGIIEEREDRTLDLLVLSRLTASDLLWGKVGSRLLTLLTLIAAGLPALSIITSLGGVSPWEVINATSATLLVAVVLGSIGGFTALLVESTATPVVAALGFALFVLIAMPTCLFGVTTVSSLPVDRPAGLLIWLPWLPVLAQIAYLGTPVMRIATTDDSDEEFGLLSPDIWLLERFKRWVALAWIVTFVAPVLVGSVLFTFEVLLEVRIPPEPLMPILVGTWGMFALYSTTSAYLLAIMTATRAAHRRRTQRIAARAARAAVAPRSSRVWSNPVLWRAVTQHAPSGLQLALWAAVGGLMLGVAWRWGEEIAFVVSVTLWGATTTFAGVAVVRATLDERRRRTLSLVLATPLASWRILLAKAVGPQVRLAAPLVVMLLASCLFLPAADAGVCTDDHFLGPNLGRGRVLLFLTGMAWHGSSLLLIGLLATWMALWVRPHSLGWPIALGLGMSMVLGPAVLNDVASSLETPALRDVAALWGPYLSPRGFSSGLDCDTGGIPIAMALCTAVQLLASVLVLGMAGSTLHRIRWGDMARADR